MCDTQTQTRPAAHFFGGKKRVENPVQVFRLNSWTIISNPTYSIIAVHIGMYPDGSEFCQFLLLDRLYRDVDTMVELIKREPADPRASEEA